MILDCPNCPHKLEEHYIHMYHDYLPVTVCKGCGGECDIIALEKKKT